MKKIIPIAAILIAFSSINAFAQTKTPSAVVNSFERTYGNAESSVWTAVNDLYRVDFTLQDEGLTAFFSAEGELIAASRNITPVLLPIFLQSSLKKHFSKFTVSSLFEVDGRDGINYYAKVSDQKSQILLQSTSSGDWVVKR
jgi:hypothetical protein